MTGNFKNVDKALLACDSVSWIGPQSKKQTNKQIMMGNFRNLDKALLACDSVSLIGPQIKNKQTNKQKRISFSLLISVSIKPFQE